MRTFRFLSPLLLCLAGGCASLPEVDGATVAALRAADSPQRLSLLRRQAERVSGVAFTDGNTVELLRDGAGAIPAIIDAIDHAQSTIDLESYVFDDRNDLDVADHLIARRTRGVEVNLIYDAFGSLRTPRALIERLRAAGVQIVEYNPIGPRAILRRRANARDHRKILVVDGVLAITGGVNISGVYLQGASPPGPAEDAEHEAWRDTDIRVQGPAVADYQRRFLQTWDEHKGPPLAHRAAVPPAAQGDLPVQVIANTPADDEHDIYRSLLVAIELAQTSVHLTTGFFVPTIDLRHALRAAARRGVDVRVLVPSNSTSAAAVDAGRAYYEDLLEDGVRLFEYPQDRVLHAKTAVIDGAWSMVGSSNLDWRSVVLNEEINTVILGAAFGGQMEAMFSADTARSHAIDEAAWSQRSLGQRFHEWRARLFKYFL